jgi:pyruvate-formate lyase
MLYNDDVVVPGVAKSLRLSPEAAQDYYPLGCGEYMVGAASPSLLMSGWNVGKTLEAVLHNGRSCEGERIGAETGPLDSFDTYEKLYDAVCRQIRFAASLTARTYQHALEELPQHCAFLYGSLLTNDCLERGLPILDRGARYTGACVMGHGFSNAADALTAIRELVYTEKRLTLEEVVQALDADFVGYEGVRRMLLDAPKFGNDNDEADRTLVQLWREIGNATQEEGLRVGLDFLTVSSVNPGGYQMGEACGATADGRKRGEPFAIGHAPTAGFDRRGITALCNSVAKADAANGGATTSMKMSPQLFAGARPPVTPLIEAYFAQGGQQVSLTVVSRADLEAAIREPEKHTHLMVRIGGWSAKFVDQEKTVQQEILRRTQY